MGLLATASVAIDGSKFKAVNNRDKNFTPAPFVSEPARSTPLPAALSSGRRMPRLNDRYGSSR